MKAVVQYLLVLALMTGLWIAPGQAAPRRVDFAPAPLASMDGAAWSGLRFGTTQQGELHQLYRCGRGSLESSVELQQPKDSPLRIEALFGSHKKEAVLLAVALHYIGEGPDVAALKTTLQPAVDLYDTQDRLEDWHVVAFPKQGIMAFTIVTRRGIFTPLVVIASPAAVAAVSGKLSQQFTPVVTRVDPNADKPRVLEFGSATAEFTLDPPFVVKDSERTQVEGEMREQTAGGAMRYVPGADGSYSTKVQLQYDAKRGGTLTVTCKINGAGPYEPISVESSQFASVPAAKDGGVDPSWSYTALLLEAEIDVTKKLRQEMKSQGPPPVEVVRANRWLALLEQIRQASTL